MMVSALDQPIPILNIPLWEAILIGAVVFIIYLLISRKTSKPMFKALDLKKETKDRYKREYKFFGMPLGKNIYDIKVNDDDADANLKKPIAFAIGYMKVRENKQRKRMEPIISNYSKDQLIYKQEEISKQVHDKPFAELTDEQKKGVTDAAKEELRNDKIQDIEVGDKVKIERGHKITTYYEPVAILAFKVCSPDIVSKLLARFTGYGTTWFEFRADQITFEANRIVLTGDHQRRIFNNIFVFSKEASAHVGDVGFAVEREEFMGAVANSIQRVLFNNDTAKDVHLRREDARIEKDKHKAQTESHEFG